MSYEYSLQIDLLNTLLQHCNTYIPSLNYSHEEVEKNGGKEVLLKSFREEITFMIWELESIPLKQHRIWHNLKTLLYSVQKILSIPYELLDQKVEENKKELIEVIK